jgi:predicted lactoylglutathione lyase
MAQQIYVNLPVKDLERSKAFFSSLGFAFNPEFTNEKAACMIVGENIFVMLLVEGFFKSFIDKDLCDARTSTEVLVCLSRESRKEVDEFVARAVAAGGSASRTPQDYGSMYGHGFEDLDGHLWELSYLESVPDSNG